MQMSFGELRGRPLSTAKIRRSGILCTFKYSLGLYGLEGVLFRDWSWNET